MEGEGLEVTLKLSFFSRNAFSPPSSTWTMRNTTLPAQWQIQLKTLHLNTLLTCLWKYLKKSTRYYSIIVVRYLNADCNIECSRFVQLHDECGWHIQLLGSWQLPCDLKQKLEASVVKRWAGRCWGTPCLEAIKDEEMHSKSSVWGCNKREKDSLSVH